MAKRRGHGEGSIYQRASDGLWIGSVSAGWGEGVDRETGAPKSVRKRVYVSGKTQQEVREKLTKLKRDQDRGLPIRTERITVAEFLDRWLRDVVEPSVRPATLTSYRGLVSRHIVPELGRVQLAKLTGPQVQTLLNKKRQEGLSPRTVQYIRGVLRSALNQALKWDLVARNVAMLAEPPRSERKERRPLSVEQARRLLAQVQGDRLEALYSVAVAVGLREGEALGLRWRDVDLEQGTLTVRHALQRVGGKSVLVEPKTEKSRRTLALPGPCLARLREHKARQRAERELAGTRWVEHDLVFTTTIGTPVDPSKLRKEFAGHLAAARIPRIRFHDLRHTAASLLVAEGVHPRAVMDVLGHSQISITMNLYSHVMPDQLRDAADRVGALLGDREEAG